MVFKALSLKEIINSEYWYRWGEGPDIQWSSPVLEVQERKKNQQRRWEGVTVAREAGGESWVVWVVSQKGNDEVSKRERAITWVKSCQKARQGENWELPFRRNNAELPAALTTAVSGEVARGRCQEWGSSETGRQGMDSDTFQEFCC